MMRSHLLGLIFVFTLSACNDDRQSGSKASPSPSESTLKLQELGRELDETLSSAKKKLAEITPSKEEVQTSTLEEIAKLHILEYKVVDLPHSSEPSKVEDALSLLGQERWECFHVESYSESLRVFCKRHPKTYLRYLPRIFP